MEHPFCADIDFEKLARKEIKPPIFLPSFEATNFDQEDTILPIEFSDLEDMFYEFETLETEKAYVPEPTVTMEAPELDVIPEALFEESPRKRVGDNLKSPPPNTPESCMEGPIILKLDLYDSMNTISERDSQFEKTGEVKLEFSPNFSSDADKQSPKKPELKIDTKPEIIKINLDNTKRNTMHECRNENRSPTRK